MIGKNTMNTMRTGQGRYCDPPRMTLSGQQGGGSYQGQQQGYGSQGQHGNHGNQMGDHPGTNGGGWMPPFGGGYEEWGRARGEPTVNMVRSTAWEGMCIVIAVTKAITLTSGQRDTGGEVEGYAKGRTGIHPNGTRRKVWDASRWIPGGANHGHWDLWR